MTQNNSEFYIESQIWGKHYSLESNLVKFVKKLAIFHILALSLDKILFKIHVSNLTEFKSSNLTVEFLLSRVRVQIQNSNSNIEIQKIEIRNSKALESTQKHAKAESVWQSVQKADKVCQKCAKC